MNRKIRCDGNHQRDDENDTEQTTLSKTLEELTVSSQKVKVPPFDALSGVAMPFPGFGDVLPYSAELETTLRSAAADARERLRKGFPQRLESPSEIPKEVDQIIAGMWSTGWNPLAGNVNLLVRDFGLVLTQAVWGKLGGVRVFRSKEDFNESLDLLERSVPGGISVS